MNDLLRMLRKILRHYNYDIKERYEYNLLPIKNIQEISQLSALYNTQDSHVSDNSPDFNSVYLSLRTCIRKENAKPKGSNAARVPHTELVFRCLKSMVSCVNYAINKDKNINFKFIIFDDHSDDDVVTHIRKQCELLDCDWEFKTTSKPGQGESLLEQFTFAKNMNGLFYFIEDDYLHEECALFEMYHFYKDVFEHCKTHLLIHPQEHEVLYNRYIYPNYLLLGTNRHWRTISHATHVFFTHSDIVKNYWHYFENTKFVGNRQKRRLGSEAKTTNQLFNHIPGFAPIPALAGHMQPEECMPPFFDWKTCWEKSRPD